MQRLPENKKGFTLVELMMVIFIIASLSVLAVDSYTKFRRNSLINLTVDSFVSQVNDFKNRTALGTGNRDRYQEILDNEEETISEVEVSAGCYVLRFENDVPVFYREDFDDTKVYKPGLGRIDFNGCTGEGEEVKFLEMENGVVVTEVPDDAFVRFIPPRGAVESNFGEGVVVFGYENDELERYVRRLRFDSEAKRFVDLILKDE